MKQACPSCRARLEKSRVLFVESSRFGQKKHDRLWVSCGGCLSVVHLHEPPIDVPRRKGSPAVVIAGAVTARFLERLRSSDRDAAAALVSTTEATGERFVLRIPEVFALTRSLIPKRRARLVDRATIRYGLELSGFEVLPGTEPLEKRLELHVYDRAPTDAPEPSPPFTGVLAHLNALQPGHVLELVGVYPSVGLVVGSIHLPGASRFLAAVSLGLLDLSGADSS